MKSMHRIHVQASPEQAYAALATARGVRCWWTDAVDMDERENGLARFTFYDGTQFWSVRIDELRAPARVAWTVLDSSIPGLAGTTVRFEITGGASDTIVDFMQDGLPDGEIFAIFNSGWYLYLSSLRQFLETGTGHPHPYLDFARPNLWFTSNNERSAKPAIEYAKGTT